MTKRFHKLINHQVTFIIMIILIIIVKTLDDDIDHPPDLLISPQAGDQTTSLCSSWSPRPSSTKDQDVGIRIQHLHQVSQRRTKGYIFLRFPQVPTYKESWLYFVCKYVYILRRCGHILWLDYHDISTRIGWDFRSLVTTNQMLRQLPHISSNLSND